MCITFSGFEVASSVPHVHIRRQKLRFGYSYACSLDNCKFTSLSSTFLSQNIHLTSHQQFLPLQHYITKCTFFLSCEQFFTQHNKQCYINNYLTVFLLQIQESPAAQNSVLKVTEGRSPLQYLNMKTTTNLYLTYTRK